VSVNPLALPMFALLPVPVLALRRVCERTATISSTFIVLNHQRKSVSSSPQDFATQKISHADAPSQHRHPRLFRCAVDVSMTLLSQVQKAFSKCLVLLYGTHTQAVVL
jgi:hypothetical protein